MPLNPEEVVNKRFSPTKFRQGYDEEEVDEFLDEVVAELRRLNAENDELRSKLTACESRVSELSRASGARPQAHGAPAAAGTEHENAPASAVGQPAAEQPAAEQRAAGQPVKGEPAAAQAPAQAADQVPTQAAPEPAAQPAAPAPAVSGPESAAGMLALAQRLHDEHVQAGKDERAKIVGEAQEHASRLVREAQDTQRRTLGDLEQQRQVLERQVEQLRSFEREYRSRLKAYLENQLRDLEAKTPVAGRTPEAAGADGGAQASGGGQDTPRFPFSG
jgi:DivIVA domain-containing protein